MLLSAAGSKDSDFVVTFVMAWFPFRLRRPRGSFFWDGNASIRYAVAVENPAFAARK
jgi:hypothetical protein